MRILSLCLALTCLALPLRAEDKTATFDYYVLSLSWSPNWCVREGDRRNSEQCITGSGHGWILHGLWPQFHRGYPAHCQTAQRPPNRSMTAGMADIMGTSGLAWHQWKKHGTCTGLSAKDYYATSRRAYEQITRPAIFRKLDRAVKLPAHVVEDAFLRVNPDLIADGITITCKQGQIHEARICLSKDLQPVPCGRDVIRDCAMKDALFTPLR